MKITSKEAFELSKLFRDLSVAVGTFRFDNWDQISPAQKQKLESMEWSLLNFSSDFNTMAVGLVLKESEISYNELIKSTEEAKKVVQKLKKVKKAIKIATAAVGLGAAIISKNPSAIAENVKAVFDSIAA